MKKLYVSILLILFVLFPINVLAKGSVSVSPSSLTIEQGSSKTITISAYNTIGDVTISSSNVSIATVSSSFWGTGMVDEGQTKTGTITVKGINVGTSTITLNIDAATFDGEDLSGQTKTIKVNVIAKKDVSQEPSQKPSTENKTPTDTRSTNTELNKLTINGKEISKVNNEFFLEVGNYVEKVNVDAIAKDSKSSVSGTGSVNLKVGENKFNVVVTAEKGNKTSYTVKVVRREYNILGDFNELLKLDKDVEIKITDNDKLVKEHFDKIINSGNDVTLVKMSDDNKNVLYSFILDGSVIDKVDEFNPNIFTYIKDNEKMEEALNYADGIYLDFSNCGDVPSGISFRYFVGDKYKENERVNLYAYNNDKVTKLKENVLVKDGYVEFEVTDTIKYFISKSNVLNVVENNSSSDLGNDFNIWFIISMILILIIILLILVMFLIKSKSNLKKLKNNNMKNIDIEDVSLISEENNITKEDKS